MRYGAGLGLFCLIVLSLPLAASAHVIQTDGSIEALLHINPDDKPLAGQTAGLTFTLTDSGNKFSAQSCDCRIIIKNGSQTLLDRPVTAREARSGRVIWVDYTFPYQSVYDVTLKGAPRQADGFQAFQLDYDDVRVERGTIKAAASPLITWGVVGVGGIALLAAGYSVYRELRHDSHT
jgi:hypothetical protein